MNNDLLSPQTAPESILVQVNCFDTVERAEKFGHRIAMIVRSLSRYMNLSRLDGITIAADYDEALKRLDRGFAATFELSRTKDAYGEGVAMAAMVQRDGVQKRHIILNASDFIVLEDNCDPPSEAWHTALYLLAHECGHVHDMEHFDRTFPGKLGAPYDSVEQSVLFPPMHVIWEEYAAVRLAAPFCGQFFLNWRYTEFLLNSLRSAPAECKAALTHFRLHQEHYRVYEEVERSAFNPLKYLSYLFGAMDGIPLKWEDFPSVISELNASSLYCKIFNKLHEELQRLWNSRDNWETFDVFTPLMDIAWELFSSIGLVFHRHSDGEINLQVIET